MFEHILYPIHFQILLISFFTLGVSSLLPPLNNASVHLVDDEGSFQFSPEAEFISPLHVQVTFPADTKAESLCFVRLQLRNC